MTTTKQRKRKATRFERMGAAAVGGRRTFNSGAGDEKADARAVGRFRIESKSTSKISFNLTRTMYEDLWRVAKSAGEIPLFMIQFRMQGTSRPFEVVGIEYNDLRSMAAKLLDSGTVWLDAKCNKHSIRVSSAQWIGTENIHEGVMGWFTGDLIRRGRDIYFISLEKFKTIAKDYK